jgi:hypothetical protein
MSGRNPRYYYFHSEEEIPHMMGLFRQSRYRYLHFSTHATEEDICTTHGLITYERFSNYLKDHIKLCRLFFSACQVGNLKFANTIAANNKGMHSILAPAELIDFSHAAALWSVFYLSMFVEDEDSMKSSDIEVRIQALTTLLPIDFFFAGYEAHADHWTYKTIKKRNLSSR